MKNPNAPRTTNSLALTEKHTSPVCERANLPYPIGGVNPPFWGSPYFLGIKAKRATADRPRADTFFGLVFVTREAGGVRRLNGKKAN